MVRVRSNTKSQEMCDQRCVQPRINSARLRRHNSQLSRVAREQATQAYECDESRRVLPGRCVQETNPYQEPTPSHNIIRAIRMVTLDCTPSYSPGVSGSPDWLTVIDSL